MATIALAALGSTTFGAPGAFIGTLIGSYIDQQFIFPKIFGSEDIEGPRIRDFRLQTASEGAPLQRCFGPQNRVAGVLIWLSDDSPIEESNEDNGGGKGGGGSDRSGTTYTYYANLAVAVCEGPIADIKRIWTDGKLLFDTPDEVNVSSNHWWKVEEYVPGDGTGRVMKIYYDTAAGSPDVEKAGFVTGQEATVDGFIAPRDTNNGTYTLKKIKRTAVQHEEQTLNATGGTSGFLRLGFDGVSTGTIAYDATASDVRDALISMAGGTKFVSADLKMTGGPLHTTPIIISFYGKYLGDDVELLTIAEDQIVGATPTVTETIKGWKRGLMSFKFPKGHANVVTADPLTDTVQITQTPTGSSVGKIKSVTRYLGDGSQTPDPLIQSYIGDTNTPAYRGTAYVVFERLKLTDFGNRIPNFTFEIVEATTRSVGETITAIVNEAGLTDAQIDVTTLTESLDGYSTSGPQKTAQKLEPLMIAYDLAAREHNDVITFIHRGEEQIYSINEDDLGAFADGNTVESKITSKQEQPAELLPREVEVEYIEYANNMQKSSQRMSRINAITAIVKKISLPIVLTPSTARDIAARLLWEEWSSRIVRRFTLPPSYIDLQAGDVALVTDGDETYKVKLTTVERGFNFMRRCEGFTERRPLLAWNSPADGYHGGDDGDRLYTPPDVIGFILDIPALRAGDEYELGLYTAAFASDRSAPWQGAEVYRAGLGKTNYGSVASVPREVAGGDVLTVLGAGDGPGWDFTSTVDVVMAEGSLSSATLEQVTSGEKNWFLLGEQGAWEVFAAMTVTAIDTNTYRLSRLLRGLRNTAYAMSLHTIDDVFMVLSSDRSVFTPMNLINLGVGFDFKIVPDEGVIADTDVTTTLASYSGATRKCFPPIRIRGSRDGILDLTITWERRSRVLFDPFGAQGTPIASTSESYEIDIEAPGGGGTVVRTLTSTIPSVIYTATEQIEDGYTPGDPVSILSIHQMDEQVGRGYPSEGKTL